MSMTDIHSYYDPELVKEISAIERILLGTLAIPLAPIQTVFGVHDANVIHMPHKHSIDA